MDRLSGMTVVASSTSTRPHTVTNANILCIAKDGDVLPQIQAFCVTNEHRGHVLLIWFCSSVPEFEVTDARLSKIGQAMVVWYFHIPWA
ncbi:hypothetical protein D9613_002427 [Agrocybe pediades]|uniref:Uncharacterized protein n=1 Tax=Agrocybe pediades TaxID=84607 RepID=A0A8H4VUZ3_9AGAR|nr:hypothetical protein D9613_002427 [Agrocybe pediades]